uniref:Retrovirus-related Pol polyprotein from transposon TNT 1-94-like beta-barrel domain-containing protein n=1 Tax=Fagus sylvatica TaxID=28930 RepID=A0A2N9H4J8_FAGSY
MTGEDGKTSRIEKFDGTDFGYWKMQIEDYLYGKKLHLPLLGKKPDKMEDAEWALLDRQETTTVGLMTALSGMYEKPSDNNKVHLMKKLFNLKMAEGAAVAKHLNEFNTITNQLSSVEIEFNDEIRVLIVLASLPNSWEAMRMAVVDSVATHHVVRTKELFTTYKVGDFGTVKMGNTSYSKIVGIGDVCIKTNVGFTVMLKNVRHVPDLCFNLISTPVMDREGYCNHLGNGRWKLAKGPMVVARGRICCGLYRTRVKACKKKFNAVGTIEKTPQSRVKVNCVTPKRVKFSLPDSATDGGAICDDDEVKDSKDLEQGERAPTLEMVEPHEKRSIGECRKDNFKNLWSSDEGEPENWIKDIQGEINSLRMKGIDIDMVFSLLVKMLKKLELHATPTGMDSN